MTRIVRWAACLIAVQVAVMGCAANTGQGSSPPVASLEPAASAAVSTAPSAPVETGVIADIKERGVLRVGMTATLRPFEYFEGTEIVGLDPDLIHLIADELGVEAEIIDTEWTGVIPSLYANKFDTIVSHMSVTSERAEQVLFTQPYGEATLQFFVKADRDDIQTAADLEGRVIGGTLGSASQTGIENWQKAGHEFEDVLYLANFQEGIPAINAGRVDAWVVTVAPAALVVKEFPDQYKLIPGFGPDTYIGIPFRETDAALCQVVDNMLTELKASGGLKELQMKWLGFEVEAPAEYEGTTFPVKRC